MYSSFWSTIKTTNTTTNNTTDRTTIKSSLELSLHTTIIETNHTFMVHSDIVIFFYHPLDLFSSSLFVHSHTLAFAFIIPSKSISHLNQSLTHTLPQSTNIATDESYRTAVTTTIECSYAATIDTTISSTNFQTNPTLGTTVATTFDTTITATNINSHKALWTTITTTNESTFTATDNATI